MRKMNSSLCTHHRLSPRNRAEERSRTDWELLIRDKFAQALRAGLEDNMTLQQAAAFAKEEFISSLQYMDLHQLGEVTAFGISIMNQVKSQILACKYITEAQRFATLVKTLPVTGNTMVFVIAMQELLIDMVAHAARHGTDELSDKWKQTTAYSLCSARVVWQSFLDDGLVQQAKPASNAHIVQWSEKQVEEFSDKRVRREIEQLTHTVQELKKEPREHEFLRWLLGMGGVVVSLQETRTSMPLHERVWRELSAEIRLKTPERWSAINQHMHTATPYVLIERLISKTKHLAGTAAVLMKDYLNSIVNGEFWRAAKYAIDSLRIERLSHFSDLRQWVTEEIPLSDIKLRLQGLPDISQERRTCIGSFDASFDEMCERVEALSRSQVGLSITKERHAIRVNQLSKIVLNKTEKTGAASRVARGIPIIPIKLEVASERTTNVGRATVITTTTASEEATETTGRTVSEAKAGVAATGRATTNADRPNGGLATTTPRPNGGLAATTPRPNGDPATTTLTGTGDARITYTAATGEGSSWRTDAHGINAGASQVIPDGIARKRPRRPALVCSAGVCCTFATNVRTHVEASSRLETGRRATHKSTFCRETNS